jgi:hypothetical protein
MGNNIKDRINFLMNFDPKKNLSEQTGPGIMPTKYGYVPDNIEPKEDPNKYPKYCKYPSMAVLPSKNSAGASGEDALIPNYCCYKSPRINSVDGGEQIVYIPKDSEISFVTPRAIERTAESFALEYGESKRDLIVHLSKILPIGSVVSFYNDKNEKYVARLWKKGGIDEWVFKWYHKQGEKNQPYVQPTWEDPRSGYAKFIDKWGQLMAWTTFIVSAILSPFTGGGSYVLWIELAAELGVGIAVAIRDLQKGDNIGAFFSVLQGILPLLKTTKILTGISELELKELQEEIVRAGINSRSSQQEVIVFYNSLSPKNQKTLTKIFDQDPYTKVKLSKNISKEIGDDITKQVMNELKIMFEQNPNLLKDLKLLEKLWARELGLNGIVMLIEFASEITLGKKLNNQEKEKLSQIFYKIPESHREEFFKSFMSNAEKLDEIINSEETEKFRTTSEVDMSQLEKYLNYVETK